MGISPVQPSCRYAQLHVIKHSLYVSFIHVAPTLICPHSLHSLNTVHVHTKCLN